MAQIIYPKFQALDDDGSPMVGGKLYTYLPGTSTDKISYSDTTLATPNTNPVILDSRGECNLFGSGLFKLVLVDSDDELIWTADNVLAMPRDDQVVYPEDYGAVGDFDPVTQTGTDDLAAFQAAVDSGARVLALCPGKNYGLNGTLDITSDLTIIMNDASFHRIPLESGESTGYLLNFYGDVGTYYSIDANADAGKNVIECATLAASLQSGDIIKILSTTKRDTIELGEMQTVLAVDSPNIYLGGVLNDSYTTAAVSTIAKVSEIKITIIGTMRIYQYPVSASQRTWGVNFRYVAGLTGHVECYNCTRTSIEVNSCFAPQLTFFTRNTDYNSTSNSYGLSITNTTMNGIFRGVVIGARHCVMCGGSTAYKGISWNNHVSVIGYGLEGNAMFDAHAETGSIYYENCHAIGGNTYNLGGATETPCGFSLCAKQNYIRNCYYWGSNTGVKLRNDAVTIDTFVIDGLFVKKCLWAISFNPNYSQTIEKLYINNVIVEEGNGIILTSEGYYDAGPPIVSYFLTVNALSINNVHVQNGSYLFYAPSTLHSMLPETVIIDNCSVHSDALEPDDGLYLNNSNIDTLILNNINISGQDNAMRIYGGLTRLEMNNVRITDCLNSSLIRVYTGNISKVVINGGYFADSAVSIFKLFTSGNTLSSVYMNNITVRDAAYFVSCEAGAYLNSAVIGIHDFPAGYVLSNLYSTTYFEEKWGVEQEIVLTGSPTLRTGGVTKLNSVGGAITATLPDGDYAGQQKVIVMTDATTSSTVSVTHHTTSDPEEFTFADLGDSLILCWNGTDWFTVANNGVAT